LRSLAGGLKALEKLGGGLVLVRVELVVMERRQVNVSERGRERE
jgi:hypothetical protein